MKPGGIEPLTSLLGAKFVQYLLGAIHIPYLLVEDQAGEGVRIRLSPCTLHGGW